MKACIRSIRCPSGHQTGQEEKCWSLGRRVQRWTSVWGGRARAPAVSGLWSVSTAVWFQKSGECGQTHLLKGMLGVEPCPVHPHREIQAASAKSNTRRGMSGNLRTMCEQLEFDFKDRNSASCRASITACGSRIATVEQVRPWVVQWVGATICKVYPSFLRTKAETR